MIQTRSNKRTQSRRQWLQLGWKSAAAAALALGGTRLQAGSNSGRALVHLQLSGGHDSNNMMVPLDANEYRRYKAARGVLALPSDSLLPLDAPRLNARYGLHPSLTELHDLYQRKLLAVVANTGSISHPGTKLDTAAANVNPVDHVTQELMYVKDGFNAPAWAAPLLGLGDMIDLRATMFTFSGGVSLVAASASVPSGGSRFDNPAFVAAMAAAPIRTVFPNSTLGRALKSAAQLVYAAPQLSIANPVILCNQSGYDTHTNQLTTQASLYRDLSASLAAFDNALIELAAASRVTLFTQTEFNRTLLANKTGGTEHAWGGHQLVLGHSVLGGDVYGQFPSLSLGGPNDASNNGTWIPSTSNVQYHATLANWMGASVNRIPQAFPALTQFTVRDLGFVV